MDFPSIISALRLYSMLAGQLPTTEQGLSALVEEPTLEPLPKSWRAQLRGREWILDPWNNEYVYVRHAEGAEREFDLLSKGADGELHTEDDVKGWDR